MHSFTQTDINEKQEIEEKRRWQAWQFHTDEACFTNIDSQTE